MNLVRSQQQHEICKFVADPDAGDGMVQAVAGSGKTTTLVMAAELVTGSAVFCAFNHHIARELESRLANTHVKASTIHSLGYQTVAREFGTLTKSDGKYWFMLKGHEILIKNVIPKNASLPAAKRALCDLVDIARLTLTDLTDDQALADMADHYGLNFRATYPALIRKFIAEGDELASETGRVDFTDMLWLVHRFDLQPVQFDWVFVDEAQDLSSAQQSLVFKLRAPGGRMMFVGDENQAIFGFAGADNYSFRRIRERLNPTMLPLTTCYRCPADHIELARALVPSIQAREGAPVGEILQADDESIHLMVENGDLIICRRNAPLVKLCLKLIERQFKARIRGTDLAQRLMDLAGRIGRRSQGPNGERYNCLPIELESHRVQARDEIIRSKGASITLLEGLEDDCEALLACYRAFPFVKSAIELGNCIKGLYSDDSAGIWLSSIHRAKGLEDDRVWILEFEKLGQGRRGQQAHEIQQEFNLKYVALTRAKRTLVLHRSGVAQRGFLACRINARES